MVWIGRTGRVLTYTRATLREQNRPRCRMVLFVASTVPDEPVGTPHRLEAHQRFKIEGVTPSNTFTDAYVLGHVIHRVMTSESGVGNRGV
jgi:hypothetical protein